LLVPVVISTRVLLANRLLIKRLVLERILYSELGSLQQRYQNVFGSEVRTDQLEAHVFNDINETLNLFNTTLPSMMRGAYTLAISAHELYTNRDAFDVLSLIRPSIVGLVGESVNWMREKYIVDAQTIAMQRNASAMSRVVSNIVDGLAEVQTNNMQRFQLRMLDGVSRAELASQQGTHTFVNNMYRQVSNRSVFDFASEVYVVRLIMQRRGISHEMYRKVQNDIDYVTRLFGRLWSMGRDGVRVMDTQERVIALLNLPSFIHEDERSHARRKHIIIDDTQKQRPRLSSTSGSSSVVMDSNISPAPFDFQTLHFKRCLFRYKPDLPPALHIHAREADEPIPFSEQSLENTNEATVRSTNPMDLMREVERVIGKVPPLPSSVFCVTSSTVDELSSPVSVSESPQESSTVMNDLMHTPNPLNDRQEQIGVDITSVLQSYQVPLTLDPELQDLDVLLREHENSGTLRFKSATHSSVPHTTADDIHVPSPPPSASPSTVCDAGTILFERGKTYALVGQNRSGKSTLMQILCKLHAPDPADCCIELNGEDFMSMPRMALRDHLSYVAQRPFIFPGTIEENIRVGNSTATNSEVQRAAEMAGIFSLEKPKPLISGSMGDGQKSLVDRTGSMKIVLKPWEQNRLKTVALTAGNWLYGQWMRLHGFQPEETTEEDVLTSDINSDASANVAQPSAQSVRKADSNSPASSSSISTACTGDIPLHPTLLLETAERGSNLSGGFAQSVALARVFLRKTAQIVILDESMGQMDALKKRELIFPTLFQFVKEHRMTLIIISHDVSLLYTHWITQSVLNF
jgi:ABC-type multidrug transport system fused ATPase/permease subunit